MSASPATQSGKREWLVLAIAAVSVAALLVAGLSSESDPAIAGQATLARLSGEVASAVTEEWEQLRRVYPLDDDSKIRWGRTAAPEPQAAVHLQDSGEDRVAQALMLESRRLEQEAGDANSALDVMVDLFDKEPGRALLAAARLRAIQLAVRTGRKELAAEQWALARAELSGRECIGATSQLLLCALAAAPALSLEQRASARDELVTLWITGALVVTPDESLREVYRERVQALLPEADADERLDDRLLRERTRKLEQEAGQALSIPEDGHLCVLRVGDRVLLYRASGPNAFEGYFVSDDSFADVFEAAIHKARLLPDDFALDFSGTDTKAGVVVRERTQLSHGAGSFVVRHSNPDAILSAVGERQALLRAALFALALAVAGAGFSVFRAIRRERYLGELKSTFVANVSHELRTPVSSILLMAENLENERVTDSETRSRYHRLIRREAGRLRRLVDDVLDFSRIERGKGVHLSRSEVATETFAKELEEDARERVTSAGGELTFRMNGVPTSMHADADALRRATLNLVENALRHSGETDVELALSNAGAAGLSIQVRDRGRGIPEARLESLFTPFERLEERLGDAGGSAGTGLGLAIVREIAEGHGGTATARRPGDATDNRGVLFEILIPTANPLENS